MHHGGHDNSHRASSLRVSWVKGHATEEHFAKGQSTPLLNKNDKADAMADRGVLEHCDGLLQLTHYHSSKQRGAKELLVRIHNMFLRVLKADEEIRDSKQKAEEAIRKITQGTNFDTVIIPAQANAPKLSEWHQAAMDKVGTVCSMSNNQLDVYNFLRTARWKATQGGENGSSFVELLARFMMLGGQVLDTDDGGIFAKKPSLAKLLANFINTTKQMVITHMLPEDRYPFRPARAKQLRLQRYGLSNHLPCISAEICSITKRLKTCTPGWLPLARR